MLYAGTTLEIDLTITDKNGVSIPLNSVTVVVKNPSDRFEKTATVTGDGTCTVTLSPEETAVAGNYHVQPIAFSGESRIPGTPRTFELKETL